MYNQHLELLVKMRCDIGCLQRTSHKGYQSITTQSTRAVVSTTANRSWIHHRNSLYPACQSIQSNPIHSRFLGACLSSSPIAFVRKLSTKVPIPPSSTVEKYWDDVMLNSNYPDYYTLGYRDEPYSSTNDDELMNVQNNEKGVRKLVAGVVKAKREDGDIWPSLLTRQLCEFYENQDLETASAVQQFEESLEWFGMGFLDLERITWHTPASILEKIISYEAVHAIGSWDGLKQRLGPGRLCYCFFHRGIPQEPLTFVQIHIPTPRIPQLPYFILLHHLNVMISEDTRWLDDPDLSRHYQPIIERLCSQYLILESKRSFALDPVGNFHLRNGAAIHQLNWRADTSDKGTKQSFGMMVNYIYNLDDVEANNQQYLLDGIIAVSNNPVQPALEWAFSKMRKRHTD
ncbi:hypothetical protein BDEG_23448 [Batrachochytrium dendrobatidis JEL423]|uniref:Malonyl-CoA decarboxylase C-terminal domain-containing protein n=1 Tax=Batrachochytrium dendrobatidis (strain JEL423) TaxID=403673 RepID=A0A177WJG8_BATDL|nr:hypothetical protein BDEG_23448 [Batrachochytrium dendrobatidis JEL423]